MGDVKQMITDIDRLVLRNQVVIMEALIDLPMGVKPRSNLRERVDTTKQYMGWKD